VIIGTFNMLKEEAEKAKSKKESTSFIEDLFLSGTNFS